LELQNVPSLIESLELGAQSSPFLRAVRVLAQGGLDIRLPFVDLFEEHGEHPLALGSQQIALWLLSVLWPIRVLQILRASFGPLRRLLSESGESSKTKNHRRRNDCPSHAESSVA
jgi:hypothetical protein